MAEPNLPYKGIKKWGDFELKVRQISTIIGHSPPPSVLHYK